MKIKLSKKEIPEHLKKYFKKVEIRQKSLLLIPERFAIMCVDELGLILRNHIAWSKPNSMPESVTDRFSKKWESIFMFTKQSKYYFNLDAVKEPFANGTIERIQKMFYEGKGKTDDYKKEGIYQRSAATMNRGTGNKILSGELKGRNPGDVFSFPLEWQPENLTREESAYIAALIDGEGSIIIQEKSTNDCLQLAIVNTHKGVIEWLANKWGKGRIYQRKRDSKWRETFEYNLYCSSAEKLIKAVYPWLIIKKEQAKTALEFQSLGVEVGQTIIDTNKTRRKYLIEINHKLNKGEIIKSDSPEPFMLNFSSDVWNIPTQPSPEKHFAMWPEKLVERMILCSTKVGDTVLDPFCGSGTTLRVADRLNTVGMGIDLGYEDISSRRLKYVQKELTL